MKEVELILRVTDEHGMADDHIWSFGEMQPELADFFAQTMKKRIDTRWWRWSIPTLPESKEQSHG